MSKRYQVTKDELRARLKETLSHMSRSAAEYDAGDESEARRLATSIRLLVKHSDKGQTKGLLHQLGLLPAMSFLDTCGHITPGNLLTDCPMVLMQVGPGAPGGGQFKPRLGEVGPPWEPNRYRLFPEWWGDPIIRNGPAKVEFCRREIVLSVAEQDGGAHVDPELNAKYAALTRENAFGWTLTTPEGQRPMRPIELAHVRQIAYEVIVTLTQKVPGVLGTSLP